MIKSKLKISLIILFSIALTGIQAQEIHETIPATGGNASGSGGTVSYSVGQIVYMTIQGATETIAEGVQQPYEISEITNLNEELAVNISFNAYPNPASDYLMLKIEGMTNQKFSYSLFDINGKIVKESESVASETKISLENMPKSIYFLKIANKKKEVKTFKIIKN